MLAFGCFLFLSFVKEHHVNVRASQKTLVVKNLPANAGDSNRLAFNPWVGKIPWRRAEQPTLVFLLGKFHGKRNFPGGSAIKNPPGKQEMQETRV